MKRHSLHKYSDTISQNQSAHSDHQVLWNITIDHCPDGVLLEIFDSFRQSLQYERNYERVWNSNEGWFKLAHVCQEWRQVVLTSPSRLRLRLLLTEHRSASASAIKPLPPLPIIVDYKSGRLTPLRRMVSALKYPDRVCGIAFKVPRSILKELWAAMNQPFPALDSLEVDCTALYISDFPPPILMVQSPHLRHLKLTGTTTTFSCRILSHKVSLVDLTLCLDAIFLSPLEAQFLSHLQAMPFLRRLKLELRGSFFSSTRWRLSSMTKDFLLPMLNFLCFTGDILQFEALMVRLEAPSLQELRISLHRPYSAMSHCPYLSKFVSNIGGSFSCAQLKTSREEMSLFMSTHSHPHFKIIVNPMTLNEHIDAVFSATLATIEDVFLTALYATVNHVSLLGRFLAHFRNAKILRISQGIESEVLDVIQQGNERFSLNIFPVLEEIEFNATMYPDSPTQIDEDRQAAVLDLFKPLVNAQQEKGHTVNVHWNTDRVHPKHCYDWDTDM